MGRPTRIHYPGAIYHVMGRGNGGRDVFLDDLDANVFCKRLTASIKAAEATLFAFCLMPNHYHLLLQVAHIPLARIIQPLQTHFVLYWNKRRQTLGHLFQARYHALMCENERYLAELVRYIHLNPVRAGLRAEPAQWPWSTHRDYLRGESARVCTTPLGLFSGPTGIDDYRSLLAEAGSDPLDRLELAATIEAGLALGDIRSSKRGRHPKAARMGFVKAALAQGYSGAAIAAFLSRSEAAISALRNGADLALS